MDKATINPLPDIAARCSEPSSQYFALYAMPSNKPNQTRSKTKPNPRHYAKPNPALNQTRLVNIQFSHWKQTLKKGFNAYQQF